MNKKLLWTMLAMLMCTTPMWGQVNNNDDGTERDQVEVKTIQGNNNTLAIKELASQLLHFIITA